MAPPEGEAATSTRSDAGGSAVGALVGKAKSVFSRTVQSFRRSPPPGSTPPNAEGEAASSPGQEAQPLPPHDPESNHGNNPSPQPPSPLPPHHQQHEPPANELAATGAPSLAPSPSSTTPGNVRTPARSGVAVYVSPFNFENANANNVSEDSLDRARRMIDLDPSHARRSFATAGELTIGRSGRSADDTARQATVEPARPSLASQTPPAMTVEALERRRGLSQSQSQQVGAFQRSDEQRKSSRKRERERERDVGTQLSLGFASRKSPRLEDRVPTEDQPGSVATARRILQSLDGLETASASAAQSKQRFEGANGAKVAPPPNQSSLGSVALRQDALTPAHEGQQKPQHRPRSTHVSEQPQTPTTGDESNRRKEKPKSPPPTFDFSGEAEVPIDWHRPSRTKSEQGRKEHQQEEVDNQDSQQHLQPFTNHASATQTPTAEKTDTVVVRFRSPSSKDEQATQKRRENAKAASVVTRPLFIFGSKDQRRAQFARVKLEHHQRKQQHKQEGGKQQQAEEHPQRKGSEQTTSTMEAPQEQQQQEQQQSPPANSWDPALLAQTKQHMDEVKSSVQQESGGGGSETKEQQQAANLASGATPAFHFGFRGEERKNGTMQATTSSDGAAASKISRTSQEAPSSFGTSNSLERGTSAFNFQPLSAQDTGSASSGAFVFGFGNQAQAQAGASQVSQGMPSTSFGASTRSEATPNSSFEIFNDSTSRVGSSAAAPFGVQTLGFSFNNDSGASSGGLSAASSAFLSSQNVAGEQSSPAFGGSSATFGQSSASRSDSPPTSNFGGVNLPSNRCGATVDGSSAASFGQVNAGHTFTLGNSNLGGQNSSSIQSSAAFGGSSTPFGQLSASQTNDADKPTLAGNTPIGGQSRAAFGQPSVSHNDNSLNFNLGGPQTSSGQSSAEFSGSNAPFGVSNEARSDGSEKSSTLSGQIPFGNQSSATFSRSTAPFEHSDSSPNDGMNTLNFGGRNTLGGQSSAPPGQSGAFHNDDVQKPDFGGQAPFGHKSSSAFGGSNAPFGQPGNADRVTFNFGGSSALGSQSNAAFGGSSAPFGQAGASRNDGQARFNLDAGGKQNSFGIGEQRGDMGSIGFSSQTSAAAGGFGTASGSAAPFGAPFGGSPGSYTFGISSAQASSAGTNPFDQVLGQSTASQPFGGASGSGFGSIAGGGAFNFGSLQNRSSSGRTPSGKSRSRSRDKRNR